MRGLYSIYLDNFYLDCYVLFIVYRKVINLVPVNIVAKLKILELIIFCTHVAGTDFVYFPSKNYGNSG